MNRALTAPMMIVVALSLAGCGGKSQKEKLELSEKCAKDGAQYFSTYRKEGDPEDSYDDPEYHYSEKLNTCLVHIHSVSFIEDAKGVTIHNSNITDIFSNKILLQSHTIRTVALGSVSESLSEPANQLPNLSTRDYYKNKDKLMSE